MTIKNTLRKILAIVPVIAMLSGCGDYKPKPTMATSIDGDSIEVYGGNFGNNAMRIMKKDGTEMVFSDQGGLLNCLKADYVDMISVKKPNHPAKIYKNEWGILDEYDPLFKEATDYWNDACNKYLAREKTEKDSIIANTIKLIKGDSAK